MRLKDQVTTSNKRDQRCAVVTNNKEAKEVHKKMSKNPKCIKSTREEKHLRLQQGGSNDDSGKVRQGTETCGARAGNRCRMVYVPQFLYIFSFLIFNNNEL
jgi:hypothetical protein